jgi:hypothetical protein
MKESAAMKRISVYLALGVMALSGCGDEVSDVDDGPHTFTRMDGATADCEFDVVSLQLGDGSLLEVSVNGLAVEAMNGADKVSASEWQVVSRRGVRFSRLLAKAAVTAGDSAPVNCVARDGWDPLRTQLGNDTSRLPKLDFVRDRGYVWVGNAGDDDPLYPEMEGKSLRVDYDLSGDGEVPLYLGGSISGLSKFRWKMLEKVDAEQRGLIEIDPVL